MKTRNRPGRTGLWAFITTAIMSFILSLRTRLHDEEPDRGSVTLEQILITVGLSVLALAVIAAVGVAVHSYMSKLPG